LLALLGVFVLASVLVFFPEFVAAPEPHSLVSIMVAVTLVAAVGSLSLRQLRFYELGGRVPNLVASLSLVVLAATALLPVVDARYSPGYWWFHVAGVLGVLGASIGMMVSKRMSRSAHEVLAPVLSRDPLVAFELGLSPIVHDFVARLDAKDQATRDHVVRTAELAIRVGERFRMSARDVRDLGLAAMLHDVGKVNTPDAILAKPARLTPDEYDIIKRHATDGEAMLRSEPTLASLAGIVRSHHERMDGAGYPDGLAGREIPESRPLSRIEMIPCVRPRPLRESRRRSCSRWSA
jgi:putative nucleotidyltransferase with HDIG domain